MDPHGVGSLYQSAPRMKMNAMIDRHPRGAQLIVTFFSCGILFAFVFLAQHFVFAVLLLHLQLIFSLGFAECTTHLVFVCVISHAAAPFASPGLKFMINAQHFTVIVFALLVHVAM